MIRILEQRVFEGGLRLIIGACKHADTKPTTGLVTGSRLTEADTGDEYMFYEDETTPGWGKIKAGPTQNET